LGQGFCAEIIIYAQYGRLSLRIDDHGEPTAQGPTSPRRRRVPRQSLGKAIPESLTNLVASDPSLPAGKPPLIGLIDRAISADKMNSPNVYAVEGGELAFALSARALVDEANGKPSQ